MTEWNFIGKFNHKLDDKNRFSMPSNWRKDLTDAEQTTITAMPASEFDDILGREIRYVLLVPQDVLKKRALAFREEAKTMGAEGRVALKRLQRQYAMSDRAEWDANGRLKIKESVLEAAGIEKWTKGGGQRVVLNGFDDEVQVWNPAEFAASIGDDSNENLIDLPIKSSTAF